jgi:hypothetical protein
MAATARTVLEPTGLLIRILENRQDAVAFRAYGECLEQQGDPRGELIALQMMIDSGAEDHDLRQYVSGYLWRHRALVPSIDPWRAGFIWKWSFIVSVTIGEPTLRDLEHLLAHPSCMMLESLTAYNVTREMRARLEALRTQIDMTICER